MRVIVNSVDSNENVCNVYFDAHEDDDTDTGKQPVRIGALQPGVLLDRWDRVNLPSRLGRNR